MRDTTQPGALLISGTVGAGKTTVAQAAGGWLRAHDVAHAVIDLDALRTAWPSPPGDRFNLSIELANLSAVAGNYLHAGARRLILAGVLEDPAMRHRYQQAVSVPLQVVRLRVDVSLARRRLRSRHAGDPAALNWHLHRAAELHDILQSVAAEDFVVDADDLTIEQAATAMIVRAGWGAATSSP